MKKHLLLFVLLFPTPVFAVWEVISEIDDVSVNLDTNVPGLVQYDWGGLTKQIGPTCFGARAYGELYINNSAPLGSYAHLVVSATKGVILQWRRTKMFDLPRITLSGENCISIQQDIGPDYSVPFILDHELVESDVWLDPTYVAGGIGGLWMNLFYPVCGDPLRDFGKTFQDSSSYSITLWQNIPSVLTVQAKVTVRCHVYAGPDSSWIYSHCGNHYPGQLPGVQGDQIKSYQ